MSSKTAAAPGKVRKFSELCNEPSFWDEQHASYDPASTPPPNNKLRNVVSHSFHSERAKRPVSPPIRHSMSQSFSELPTAQEDTPESAASRINSLPSLPVPPPDQPPSRSKSADHLSGTPRGRTHRSRSSAHIHHRPDHHRAHSGHHLQGQKQAAPLRQSRSFTLAEYCEPPPLPTSPTPPSEGSSSSSSSGESSSNTCVETSFSNWIDGLKKSPDSFSILIENAVINNPHPERAFLLLYAAWFTAFSSSLNPKEQLSAFVCNSTWYVLLGLSFKQTERVIEHVARELQINVPKDLLRQIRAFLSQNGSSSNLKSPQKRPPSSIKPPNEPPQNDCIEALLAQNGCFIDALKEELDPSSQENAHKTHRSNASSSHTTILLRLAQSYQQSEENDPKALFSAFAADNSWKQTIPSDQQLRILLKVADDLKIDRWRIKHAFFPNLRP